MVLKNKKKNDSVMILICHRSHGDHFLYILQLFACFGPFSCSQSQIHRPHSLMLLFHLFPNFASVFISSLTLQFPLASHLFCFPGRLHAHSRSEAPVPGNFSKTSLCWNEAPVLPKPGQRDLCVCCPTALGEGRLGDRESQWPKW